MGDSNIVDTIAVSSQDKINPESTSSSKQSIDVKFVEDCTDITNPKLSTELEADDSSTDTGKVPDCHQSETDVKTPPDRQKSDIFFLDVGGENSHSGSPSPHSREVQPPRRLNKLRDHASSIFPAGCMGCREDPPSDHVASPRRFLDAKEAKDYIGHIDNTPRKRPSSAKPNSRNPVTGAGVVEDSKKQSSRRKDGNPLLGEGYEDKEVTPSSTRIPPGGYSQGLW